MFAAVMIAIIPTIVVYCAFSNKIVDGLTAGAVKGWYRNIDALRDEAEIVFDTLFLERDEEDIKGEEESLKNEIYYEYIAIAYRDEVNKDNIIKTNKILTYENDN